jgi:hypothetical protein
VEHPKTVGDGTTLAVMLALQQAGFDVLVPFGENTRYDFGIDDGSRLLRVQCKTGRLRQGAVVFKTCSSYAHHREPKSAWRDYVGQVDYFAIHCRETGGVYLIPMSDLTTRFQGSLRIDMPKNNQRQRIRFASDYEIGGVTLRPGSAKWTARLSLVGGA